MTSTLLANATDIAQWADRLDARSQLPRLVRRLIQATAKDIERLHFPADEGVQSDGWDGIVRARKGTDFVPSGISVWEMGVDKSPKGKADDDYQKRSQDPLGLDTKATTFVFVTPRRWRKKNKDEWVKERRAEGKWADVRVYDADDLETWLEKAPAVHLWLSMLIGKHPQGARSLDDYWSDWTAQTNPAFSPALVIGGREAAREHIEAWLRGEAAPLSLQGESPEEALAFLAAVVAAQEKPEREAWFSRAVVVEDATSWRSLALSDASLILAPRFGGAVEGISRAVKNAHHVFAAGAHRNERGSNALPRIVRDAAEKALLDMGLPRDRASDLATLARRSLPALRRKMACEPTHQRPSWAQSQVARELLAPLLASAWQDPNLADRDILARLAGTSYEQLQDTLVRWSKDAEPPVRLVGGIWMMAAPDDAWRQLAPFLTDDDLKRFREVALDVLSAPPAPDSAIRWIGLPAGEEPRISGTLREGIASTLALMTALSSQVSFVSGSSGESVANGVVWSLFDKAKGDAALWAAFAPVLMLLAEAAPTPFLDAVDAGLSGETPFLRQMFHDQDANHGLGPTSPHTYLLWALETLTWNPDFFGRAVLCLARLTRIDPGGRNGNRAGSSLGEVFVLWYPNTTASLSRRLNALDAIRKREPTVAWGLLLGMLPTIHGGTCHPVHGPKWHDWKPDVERSIPQSEYLEGVDAVVERLLSDAGANAARWCDLIKHIEGVWPQLREKILDGLDALDPVLLASQDKLALADALRATALRHREFPDADWTMPEEHVVRLEAVEQKLQPDDPVLRHRWRFQRFVPLPERREMSPEQREQTVAQLRGEALEEILETHGWDGVLRLASEVEDPESVGLALNAMSQPPVDVDVFLAENLAATERHRAAMALGWVRPHAWRGEQAWLQARFDAGKGIWRPEQQGEFFLPHPLTPALLNQLDGLDEEAQHYYWSRTPHAALPPEPQNAKRVVERLLWVRRAAEAIRAIHWALHNSPDLVPPDRIMDVLEAAITTGPVEALRATDYDSAQLLDHLLNTNASRERLARLEWLYFGLHEHTRRPKLLHTELSRDPAFFMEVLSLLYHARPGETETDERDGEPPASSEHTEPEDPQDAQLKAALAERAWWLLHHWHQLPGVNEDGTLDEEHLKNWVTGVREQARERERSVIALIHIGQALAHSPRDEDGAWPHRAVRDIIEEIANPRLESGFYTQVFNNRGVTSRGLTDGGEQERALVERYEKDAAQIADMWPRTASVLRGLAADYRRQAEHEDRSADLTQDFWR